MIPISLPNGKTIFVKSIDEALNLDYQEAMASNMGTEINDPFFGSVLHDREVEEILPEILAAELPEIDQIEEIDLEEDIED